MHRVEPGVVHYETLDGEMHELAFDFGMLLPPFGGVPLEAFDREGADITAQLFAPSGFMKVDADYIAKPYEDWRGADWPKTYQSVGLRQRLRRRHRLRPAAPDLPPTQEHQRHRSSPRLHRAPGCRRASWARPRR